MSNFYTTDGAAFSSMRNNWETPQNLFNELNSKYHFTLDPCASDTNNKTPRYFTIDNNGLIQPWNNERVFCNPPYNRQISKWVEKCYKESIKGTQICLLIPARTDTKYFHEFIYKKPNVRIEFIKGRLKYELNGVPGGPSPFPSMLVFFNL